MKKIVIIAATPGELTALKSELSMPSGQDTIAIDDTLVKTVCSGIGAIAAAICTTREILMFEPNLLLQIGIAGSYRRDLALGEVVEVVQEQEADLGIEQRDGFILSLAESGLVEADQVMRNPHDLKLALPAMNGLTVQTVTGTSARRDYLVDRFKSDVESMEGAGFYRSCFQSSSAFGQIRAISNYVEPRDRAKWQMDLALNNLGVFVAGFLKSQSAKR